MTVSAAARAARIQWNRLGIYQATGDSHNGRKDILTATHFMSPYAFKVTKFCHIKRNNS